MGRRKYYTLNDKNEVVAVDTVEEWANWFDNGGTRRVGYDEVDGYTISTVCLGLDHSFSDVGPPIIFETLVREGDREVAMLRYSTYDAAKKSHDRMVEQAKNGEEIWHD